MVILMRTFYIFKINKEFAILTKNCPYNLFRSMEQIYYASSNDIATVYNIYEQLILPLDKTKINLNLYEKFKEDDYYTKFRNTHMINNFYSDEQTKLIVNSSFMLLRSTKASPTFLNFLKDLENMFVCDFENKDYFWLQEVTV